jgi:acetyl coenzyme A synthetase (ADP forming)-like protein
MRNNNKNLKKFFHPRSIAVIGATESKGKVGRIITENLLKTGYEGKVFLVNPNRDRVFGRICHKNINNIRENIDLAVIAVPAEIVDKVIKEAAEKVKNFVVISAGFSEIGPEGRRREEELERVARASGLNILGPNCLGFIMPAIRLNTTFFGGIPEKGNIALISQSGALAVALMDKFQKNSVGFSGVVSIGNKIQIDEADLLGYFARDPLTKVIGLYLEGIKSGPRFRKALKEAAAKKPVVIIKAGKTERAEKAIRSHTGTLAGSSRIASAFFEKFGAVEAEDFDQFSDFLRLAAKTKVPKKPEVVLVTNAGGAGVLAVDSFLGKSVKPAEISQAAREKLKKALPAESSLSNPIDVLGDADEKRYLRVLEILEKNFSGSAICLLTPQEQTPVEKIAEGIIKFSRKFKGPVLSVFMGGERIEKAVKKFLLGFAENFSCPRSAVEVLDKYYQWFLSSKRKLIFSSPDLEKREKIGKIISRARDEKGNILSYGEAKSVLDGYAVPSIGYFPIGKNGRLPKNLKYPVVLKVDSPRFLHKTDAGAVALGINSGAELESAVKKMRRNFAREELIVQPEAEKGTELIMGIKRDEAFGAVVLLGLGGIYAEALKTNVIFVPPFRTNEIKSKIMESNLNFLFSKTRGTGAA